MLKDRLLRGVTTGPYTSTKQNKTIWAKANDLKPGDKVITSDGRIATVKAINTTAGLRTVHNFSVEDYHTYFVGEHQGVWVHNLYNQDEQDAAAANPVETVNSTDSTDPEAATPEVDPFKTLTEEEQQSLQDIGIGDDRLLEIDEIITRQRAESIVPQSQSIATDLRRDVLGTVGYTDAQLTAIDALPLEQQLAIFDTDADISAARNLIDTGVVDRNGSQIRNVNLTVPQFQAAVKLGLWSRVYGTEGSGLPNQRSVDRASRQQRKKLRSYEQGPATGADQEPGLLQAVAELSPYLTDYDLGVNPTDIKSQNNPNQFERSVALGRNADGEIIITGIRVMDRQGGSPIIGSLAVIHTHPSTGLESRPGPGDAGVVKRYNIPNFVIGFNRNRSMPLGRENVIYEVGRQTAGKTFKYREIDATGTPQNWRRFPRNR